MPISTKPGSNRAISVFRMQLMKNQCLARCAWPGNLPRHALAPATVAWFLLLAFTPESLAAKPPKQISYNRDIRPVLSDKCFFCHGPDQNKRKGKLRLDLREEAIARKAFVPGKPGESELVRRIFTTDLDDQMAPRASDATLTVAQKQLLR